MFFSLLTPTAKSATQEATRKSQINYVGELGEHELALETLLLPPFGRFATSHEIRALLARVCYSAWEACPSLVAPAAAPLAQVAGVARTGRKRR